MADELFSIATIGSCRIATPTRLSYADYGLARDLTRNFGFTHSSGEAVQLMRFMKGEHVPARTVWPFVARRADIDQLCAKPPQPADFYVIEISSAKSLMIGEDRVQMNYLASHFCSFLSDAARARGFWCCVKKGDQEEMDAYLAAHWQGDDIQRQQSEMLRQVRMTMAMTDHQLRADIRALIDGLPAVLFVTHINALTPAGTPLQSRARFITQVEGAVQAEGGVVYNPTGLMREFGQAAAIADHSDSLAHFTNEFSRAVFAAWYDLVIIGRIDAAATGPAGLTKQRLNLEVRLKAGAYKEVLARTNDLDPDGPNENHLRQLRLAALMETGCEQESLYDMQVNLEACIANDTLRLNIAKAAMRSGDLALAVKCLRGMDPAAAGNEMLSLAVAAEGIAAEAAEMLLAQLRRTKFDPLPDRVALGRIILALTPEKRLQVAIEIGDEGLIDQMIGTARQMSVGDLLRTARFCRSCGRILQTFRIIGEWRKAQNMATVRHREVLELIQALAAEYPENASQATRLDFLTALLDADLRHECARRLKGIVRKEINRTIDALYAAGDTAALEAMCSSVGALDGAVERINIFVARLKYAAGDYAGALEAAHRTASNLPENNAAWRIVMRCADRICDPIAVQEAAQQIIENGRETETDDGLLLEATQRLSENPMRTFRAAKAETDLLRRVKLYRIAAESADLEEASARQIWSVETKLTRELRDLETGSEPEKALHLATSLVEVFPENEKILLSLGRLFEKRRDFGRSRDIFERLCALNPDKPDYVRRLTRSIERVSRTSAAGG